MNPHEALAALHRADSGETTLEMLPKDEWLGGCEPTYRTGDGWKVAVFDDCGDFDYVDTIWSPDGEELYLWPRWDDDVPYRRVQAFDRLWGPVRNFSPENRARWGWSGVSPTGYFTTP